jgi:cathepsin L
VKDQGQCASGWAFAAVSAQESQWFVRNGISLSEQNLVDCVKTGRGCEGGLPWDGYDYIIQNQSGLFELNSDYSSTSWPRGCRFNSSKAITNLQSYIGIEKADEVDLWNMIDSSLLSFQLYEAGIYEDSSYSKTNLNHGVTVVGWGEDDSETPYWIVRNSWGNSWGLFGCIGMSHNNDNQCMIATSAMIPVEI